MHCFISYSCFMPEISSPALRSAPPSTIDSRNCTNQKSPQLPMRQDLGTLIRYSSCTWMASSQTTLHTKKRLFSMLLDCEREEGERRVFARRLSTTSRLIIDAFSRFRSADRHFQAPDTQASSSCSSVSSGSEQARLPCLQRKQQYSVISLGLLSTSPSSDCSISRTTFFTEAAFSRCTERRSPDQIQNRTSSLARRSLNSACMLPLSDCLTALATVFSFLRDLENVAFLAAWNSRQKRRRQSTNRTALPAFRHLRMFILARLDRNSLSLKRFLMWLEVWKLESYLACLEKWFSGELGGCSGYGTGMGIGTGQKTGCAGEKRWLVDSLMSENILLILRSLTASVWLRW